MMTAIATWLGAVILAITAFLTAVATFYATYRGAIMVAGWIGRLVIRILGRRMARSKD